MTTLQHTLEAFGAAWGVPGGVVAVGGPEGAIAVTPFGFADRERGERTTARHRFEIGSISKVAAALAVLSLVDEGRLGLDAEAGALLPWLPPGFHAPGVTVRRLLQHTAGLPASIDALPDESAQLAAATPPTAVPGRRFHYSNVGYLALGRIVAGLTGQPFADALDRRVLRPAGMTSSIAAVTFDDRDGLATGYWPGRTDRPWLPGDPLVPSPFLEVAGTDGSVAAPAADLAALAGLLARRGAGVVSEAAFMAMIGELGPDGETVLQLAGLPATASSRYGLGINVERTGDRRVLTHGGGMVGFASFLHVDLGTGRTVVVVTNANGDGPVAEVIARAIAADRPDLLDGLRPDRWGVPGSTGLPRAASPDLVGAHGDLQIVTTDASDGVALTARLDRVDAPLLWTWGERMTSAHSALRRFGLIVRDGRWASGGRAFGPPSHHDPALDPYCGRYRSYSPWLPEFTVVQRDGALRLLAAGAVEAPGEDVPLDALPDGDFAIGGPDLPDRLRFGPKVDGTHVWVDKNGSRYSRAFSGS